METSESLTPPALVVEGAGKGRDGEKTKYEEQGELQKQCWLPSAGTGQEKDPLPVKQATWTS